MTKKNQNRFWFTLVMGMLSFGIGMVIWTVKQASSVPVHESNNFMLKYQMADMNINEILALEKKFNQKYTIELKNFELIVLNEELQNTNAKRAQTTPVKLHTGDNSFNFDIRSTEGASVEDANVTFLLTRPHTRVDDVLEESVQYSNGQYLTKSFQLKNKGRYTLQLKVEINGLTGYREISAYLQP
jgi:hypothetical protein